MQERLQVKEGIGMEASEMKTPDKKTQDVGAQDKKTPEELLKQAMKTLEQYVNDFASAAGESEGYGEDLWERISKSGGLLQELAYYHDYGNFLCKYQVAGYTLADVLVWQVDHFKAYLDRPLEMHRYHKEKLLLSAFDIMLQMEQNPEKYVDKMTSETGTDFVDKY